MSDGLTRLGSHLRLAMLLLAVGIAFSTVGCSSVPDVPEGAFDPIAGFGSRGKQKAFEQQVQNDPFPTAGTVGL